MNSFSKRHIIKIPKNVGMYYCDTKHIIIFANSSVQKALILKTKVIIEEKNRIIRITREPFLNMSNNEKKKLKAVQGTQVNLLKQMLLDISSFSCKKLNLIGVGFRVVMLQTTGMTLLHFKLGYSHYVYFKIPKNLEIFCLKANKLFILGDSYSFVNQVAALVRSFKIPEPYKGKGIIYTTEKITLKEGKKA
jgi:large subunit ribosomal protein L6